MRAREGSVGGASLGDGILVVETLTADGHYLGSLWQSRDLDAKDTELFVSIQSTFHQDMLWHSSFFFMDRPKHILFLKERKKTMQ